MYLKVLAGRVAVFDMFTLSNKEIDNIDVGVFEPNLDSLKERFKLSKIKIHIKFMKQFIKMGCKN